MERGAHSSSDPASRPGFDSDTEWASLFMTTATEPERGMRSGRAGTVWLRRPSRGEEIQESIEISGPGALGRLTQAHSPLRLVPVQEHPALRHLRLL